MKNYEDIKRGGIVPADANAQIRKFAELLKCEEIAKLVDMIEQRKSFGDIFVIDATGFEVMKAVFQFGIFNQGYLERDSSHSKIKAPLSVRFRESVRNDNVSFCKAKVK